MNGPMDRMLDINGFDDGRRHVCRFQPRRRISLVAVGGDTAGICESNAGDDRRKNQFHDVLVHVMPPFVLTESKEGVLEESDMKTICHFPLFALVRFAALFGIIITTIVDYEEGFHTVFQ